MSQWTHVAGLIRIDSLLGNPEKVIKDIKSCLGSTCRWEDDEWAWEECSVPCGSEGSIQYNIIQTNANNPGHISWGYISIYGDLRDYSCVNDIYSWLQNACNKMRVGIRSLIVKVDIESKASYNIYGGYSDNGEFEIKLKRMEDD